MDEDEGPHSTAEAYASLQGDAARKLLANPGLMPKPWNENRPNGWPVAEAVFTFTHESTRMQVSLHLGMLAEGYAQPVISERLMASGWHWLRQLLSRGQLSATGTPDGETEPRSIPASSFDTAQFDPVTKEVLSGTRRYSAVRIFDAAQAIETKPKKGKGGRKPWDGRDAFIREVVRKANTPDGLPPSPEAMEHAAVSTVSYDGGPFLRLDSPFHPHPTWSASAEIKAPEPGLPPEANAPRASVSYPGGDLSPASITAADGRSWPNF